MSGIVKKWAGLACTTLFGEVRIVLPHLGTVHHVGLRTVPCTSDHFAAQTRRIVPVLPYFSSYPVRLPKTKNLIKYSCDAYVLILDLLAGLHSFSWRKSAHILWKVFLSRTICVFSGSEGSIWIIFELSIVAINIPRRIASSIFLGESKSFAIVVVAKRRPNGSELSVANVDNLFGRRENQLWLMLDSFLFGLIVFPLGIFSHPTPGLRNPPSLINDFVGIWHRWTT